MKEFFFCDEMNSKITLNGQFFDTFKSLLDAVFPTSKINWKISSNFDGELTTKIWSDSRSIRVFKLDEKLGFIDIVSTEDGMKELLKTIGERNS